jgi:hypothetical protein
MSYRIVKIDPFKRKIYVMNWPEDHVDFTRPMKRVTKAKVLGHHQICVIDTVPMFAAANAEAKDGTPAFRFRGCKPTTAGIGILFGRGIKGGLIGCPADREWVEQHIVWLTGEEADAENRASASPVVIE